MILLSEMEILFAQLIVGPAATEQRQIDVALSLSMLNAKQGSSNSHLLTSFGMTRPGIEPTTSRLWGGRNNSSSPMDFGFIWDGYHGNHIFPQSQIYENANKHFLKP